MSHPEKILKALRESKKVLDMVANCSRCDHCRRIAADALGYQINPVLKEIAAPAVEAHSGAKERT